jgi:hypothetical protein
MRKLEASAFQTRKHPIPASDANDASVRLVCLALMLALIALAGRIISIW